MSQNVSVTLKVKPGSNGGNGWSDTTASNGQAYCYKYTGGNDDRGDMEQQVNTGASTLQLNLDTDRDRYSLSGATFDDPNNQLTWLRTDNATGTITDANTVVEDAKYTIQVTDTTTGATIDCDPMILNKP